MIGSRGHLYSLVLLAALLVAGWAEASQAPEFSNGGRLEVVIGSQRMNLPLRHTDVDAEVAGSVAAVTVKQEFANPYARPIEAVYVFPLPHEAAVHAYAMRIGERLITGVIKKRDEAARLYKRAKASGRTAALLDQERPNIFTQSIANIQPRDCIVIELRYVETLVQTEGRYEFVFPMVVGPRYVAGGDPLPHQKGTGFGKDSVRIPDASRVTPRLLAQGLRPGHDVAVRLTIRGGRALRDLAVVAHQAQVHQQGAVATVQLEPRDAIPNRDFVVRYRLAGQQPEVSLLAQRDKRGGHFLLMVQPQARVTPAQIAPRELVLAIDNSGSMDGFPITLARRAAEQLLTHARPTDTFQIITFSGEPAQFAPHAVAATRGNVERAMSFLAAMRGGGGTEFLPALELALESPKDPARARIVLFMTDGYIGYENEVLKFLRAKLGSSNLFALGVGTSVNRFLIDGMARLGGGEPFYVLRPDEARTVADRMVATISRPALTSLAIDWAGLDVQALSPARPPDLFADRPVVVTGRYGRGGRATIQLKGRLAGKPFAQALQVELPEASRDENRAVPLLWARRRIAELDDLRAVEGDKPARKAETIKLALAYGLVTSYTSFIAVDRKVRGRPGEPLTVPVPVPMPEGVSARAAPPGAIIGSAAGGPDCDGDGIPDAVDQCPNEPETYNGFEDGDGCPDRGRVIVQKGMIEILDKVYFASGSATIKPVSFPILDAVAATLKGNPNIKRIEIQGHVDEREGRKQKELGRRRAEAVRAYLVSRGVAANRLVVRDYADRRPVDGRHRESAWSKNRRVEWLILERDN